MKNKITLLLLPIFLMSVTSCEEEMKLQGDPTIATQPKVDVTLPFVMVNYSNRKVTELGSRLLDLPRHFSATFNSTRQGTGHLTFRNTWRMMYSEALVNLDLLEKRAIEIGPFNDNVRVISMILQAMIYYELSMLWEDVPFEQAVDPQNFPQPEFQRQEQILRGCVEILDEASNIIENIAHDVESIATADLIYEGNMNHWLRFSNSLKLRILMLIRNRDTSVDPQILEVLDQPLLDSNTQAAMLTYPGGPDQSNGYYALLNAFFGPSNEGTRIYGPGEEIYEILTGSNDPRYELFLDDPFGMGPSNGTFPEFSNPDAAAYTNEIIRVDYPDIYFLPAEITFYRAELAMKGVTSEDAQTLYESGIRQAIEFWNESIPGATNMIDAAEIDTYITGLGAVTPQSLQEQQYLETFLRPIVSWNHIRRNEFPIVKPAPGTINYFFPRRLIYPPTEIAGNMNTPPNRPTDEKMWFEKP